MTIERLPFYEARGGKIISRDTYLEVVQVKIENMTLTESVKVTEIVLKALNEGFYREMTDILQELDDLIDREKLCVFFGRSVVPGVPRFATLRRVNGETAATGQGRTNAEALISAVSNLRACAPAPATITRPVMPGITTRKMPGM